MRPKTIRRLKQGAGILLSAFMMTVAFGTCVSAWETTEYWTSCVEDIHPYGVPELMIGNYFSVNKSALNGSTAFPTDLGLETGVLPFNKVQMEVGIDAMYPSPDPYMFNAKIGTPEDAIVKGFPGIAAGVYDVGTNPSTTAYDIADIIVGKTIPYIGRLHAGYYYGNHAVLLNSSGQPENQGWMVGFDRTIWDPGKQWLDSLVLAADYASGKNYIGGGGFGIYFNWTKNISLLTGPVWFNDTGINGAWKWTTQVYVNF